MHYDPDAKLEIPPWGSISMLFWGDAVPVTPFLSTPEFIPYPTPQGMERSADWLLQFGCELDRWGWATRPADNPLEQFGCTFIVDPRIIASGIDPQTEDPDRLSGGTEDPDRFPGPHAG
jgi:hypothetical protein